MSFASILEVMVHLNNYKIHDSYSEGNYKLRFSLYHTSSEG